jgi:hypothetical protein
MITYRVSILIGKMDTSVCPPPFLGVLFPGSVASSVLLTESECLVTFDTPQTPADLGPLIKVEIIPNP